MRGSLKTRLTKLEAGVPDAAGQQYMRERIERARSRIMADMTEAEEAEYRSAHAARAEQASQSKNAPGQRGRVLSLAERITAARNAG